MFNKRNITKADELKYGQNIMFQGIFKVLSIDRQGKQFDRVQRLQCASTHMGCTLVLDVNSWLYPPQVNAKYRIAIVAKLNPLNEFENRFVYDRRALMEENLTDQYEYAMSGILFRIEVSKCKDFLTLFISYGGLLMYLYGETPVLNNFELDQRLFCLMRRIDSPQEQLSRARLLERQREMKLERERQNELDHQAKEIGTERNDERSQIDKDYEEFFTRFDQAFLKECNGEEANNAKTQLKETKPIEPVDTKPQQN